VVLQSPEEDLRLKLALLHDADQQFVREELTRRGMEVPAAMLRVKVCDTRPCPAPSSVSSSEWSRATRVEIGAVDWHRTTEHAESQRTFADRTANDW
jgi:hypothetical protein